MVQSYFPKMQNESVPASMLLKRAYVRQNMSVTNKFKEECKSRKNADR